jgi:ribonuclease VapC
MILDTSAVVAILLREPAHAALQEKLAGADSVGVGAPALLECGIVLSSRLRLDARGLLARFLQETEATIIPFDESHWAAAHQAWLRFGRGRHPAALNLGDCASYATAAVARKPLLCTGADFPQTDLALA